MSQEEFPDYELAATLSDVIPTKLKSKRGLCFGSGVQAWYTDGSLMDGTAGAGVYGSETEIRNALEIYSTIFDSEFHAIEA